MRKTNTAQPGRFILGTVSRSTRGAGTKTFEGIGLRDYGFDF